MGCNTQYPDLCKTWKLISPQEKLILVKKIWVIKMAHYYHTHKSFTKTEKGYQKTKVRFFSDVSFIALSMYHAMNRK